MIKKIFSALLCAAMTLNLLTVNISAEETFAQTVSENEEISLFDEYIEKLGDITFEIQRLEYYNSNNEYDEEIASLVAEKEHLVQQHDLYGADTIDNGIMRDIITNSDYSIANKSRYIPQSELDALVKRFETSYVVMGSSATHTEGSTVYKLYQIVVMNKSDNYFSTHRLGKKASKIFYDKIAEQSEASKFLSELIEIYASKAISATVEKIPGVAFLPYEMFFNTKPDTDKLIEMRGGLNATLTTNSIIKFTYVFNEANNSWVYCSSSNQARSLFSAVDFTYPSGGNNHDFKKLPEQRHDGGYANSITSAVAIFKAMKNNSYISSSNFCVDQVEYTTRYKGSLICEVAAPATPYELL